MISTFGPWPWLRSPWAFRLAAPTLWLCSVFSRVGGLGRLCVLFLQLFPEQVGAQLRVPAGKDGFLGSSLRPHL